MVAKLEYNTKGSGISFSFYISSETEDQLADTNNGIKPKSDAPTRRGGRALKHVTPPRKESTQKERNQPTSQRQPPCYHH